MTLVKSLYNRLFIDLITCPHLGILPDGLAVLVEEGESKGPLGHLQLPEEDLEAGGGGHRLQEAGQEAVPLQRRHQVQQAVVVQQGDEDCAARAPAAL